MLCPVSGYSECSMSIRSFNITPSPLARYKPQVCSTQMSAWTLTVLAFVKIWRREGVPIPMTWETQCSPQDCCDISRDLGPSHFESTWLENSAFIFADFQERRWWWWVHAVRLAAWCWLPAPLPVTHPLAFLESPNCFSLCAAEGHLPESRQELPFMEHFLGARICSEHFAESPHVNLWVCAFTVPAVGAKMGDTFDQAIWPGAQSSTIHSTAWLFRNLSSGLWGLNWYLREIINKSFPNTRDPPYKEPLR